MSNLKDSMKEMALIDELMLSGWEPCINRPNSEKLWHVCLQLDHGYQNSISSLGCGVVPIKNKNNTLYVRATNKNLSIAILEVVEAVNNIHKPLKKANL